MAEWAKREHGKGEIDRAGKTLVSWWENLQIENESQEERQARNNAFGIVENWRTCHGLPLNAFQSGLRGCAKKVESGVLVAQRLKRFASVMNKLVREPTMNYPKCKIWEAVGRYFRL